MAVLDTVAVASLGVYSELYGLGEEANIANLYCSFGLLEDIPAAGAPSTQRSLRLAGTGIET